MPFRLPKVKNSFFPPGIGRALSALVLAMATGGVLAQAQPAQQGFEPSVGQEGKDVVWVPTPQALVDKMLDMAKVTRNDYLIDLGSGDGRTVITAAKRGVRAMGIEYNPDMVELSRRSAQKEGVADRATFVKADLFESDFSRATVITMFLLDRINMQLRPKILGLKPGTRIVSNTFTMGDWMEDAKATANESEGCRSYCVAYLWVVPARVGGTWKLPQGQLALKQEFQMVSGELKTGDQAVPVTEGRVRGDRLTFKAGGVDYSVRVAGDRMEATGKDGAWSAVRTQKAPPGLIPAKS
jgi:precorrin-6B methylase 2